MRFSDFLLESDPGFFLEVNSISCEAPTDTQWEPMTPNEKNLVSYRATFQMEELPYYVLFRHTIQRADAFTGKAKSWLPMMNRVDCWEISFNVASEGTTLHDKGQHKYAPEGPTKQQRWANSLDRFWGSNAEDPLARVVSQKYGRTNMGKPFSTMKKIGGTICTFASLVKPEVCHWTPADTKLGRWYVTIAEKVLAPLGYVRSPVAPDAWIRGDLATAEKQAEQPRPAKPGQPSYGLSA